jgi:short subunit dehydrogenase-like uncharacterized protein
MILPRPPAVPVAGAPVAGVPEAGVSDAAVSEVRAAGPSSTVARAREFDVVLFGATGYTGRLVAEHLVRVHLGGVARPGQAAGPPLRLGLAGRDERKLASVRDGLRALDPRAGDLPLLVADAFDAAALRDVAARTAVVATTVGPYARYGAALVAACARAGTHYCDLTGELTFIRRTIDADDAAARESGARLVHCCGYDSIPSDLGAWLVIRTYQERFGALPARVVHAAGEARGGASGGTLASAMLLLEEASRDRAVRRLLADPYALVDPAERGDDGREQLGVRYDRDLGLWTGPFVMAAINARVVRRSLALRARETGAPYGRIRYEECMSTGRGPKGLLAAAALAGGLGAAAAALSVRPVRALLAARVLPKPGEGPTPEARARGYFVSRFVATGPEGSTRLTLRGDGDPGYGATSRLLGESAVCLARDALDSPGGVRTPASTMAEPLLARLRTQRFSFELG